MRNNGITFPLNTLDNLASFAIFPTIFTAGLFGQKRLFND